MAGIGSPNPQIYALGVKELWETKRPLDPVVHTLGWPLPRDAFGGSWMYPMGPNLVSLGLVVGLDYREANLDVHELMQRSRRTRSFGAISRVARWSSGAPRRFPRAATTRCPSGCTATAAGGAATPPAWSTCPSLKGIHYAMQSGISPRGRSSRRSRRATPRRPRSPPTTGCCARATSRSDLHRTRNMRLAFKSGFYAGGIKAALMSLTGGGFPAAASQSGGRRGAAAIGRARSRPSCPTATLTFSKVDAVFRSGNATRDDIPTHLLVRRGRRPRSPTFYEHLCPAGVYEAGWTTGRQRAELRRLQGDRRARAALDPARGRQRTQVSADVNLEHAA